MRPVGLLGKKENGKMFIKLTEMGSRRRKGRKKQNDDKDYEYQETTKSEYLSGEVDDSIYDEITTDLVPTPEGPFLKDQPYEGPLSKDVDNSIYDSYEITTRVTTRLQPVPVGEATTQPTYEITTDLVPTLAYEGPFSKDVVEEPIIKTVDGPIYCWGQWLKRKSCYGPNKKA